MFTKSNIQAVKSMLKKHWQQCTVSEKIILVVAIVECIWIISLQVQVYSLVSLTNMQQAQIAQLEQASKKHNNLLYSMYMTTDDIQKKWHDLNFRVLTNTWKLNP